MTDQLQKRDTVNVLTNKLTEGAGEGKKAKMTRIGLIGIAVFTALGAGLLFFKPEVAPHAVTLVTISIGAWTATAVGYVGAQAAVDAKTTTALTALTTTNT